MKKANRKPERTVSVDCTIISLSAILFLFFFFFFYDVSGCDPQVEERDC